MKVDTHLKQIQKKIAADVIEIPNLYKNVSLVDSVLDNIDYCSTYENELLKVLRNKSSIILKIEYHIPPVIVFIEMRQLWPHTGQHNGASVVLRILSSHNFSYVLLK